MAINLVTKFQPYTDEQFSTESKKALITNQDLSWTGAHTIKVYQVDNENSNGGPSLFANIPIRGMRHSN